MYEIILDFIDTLTWIKIVHKMETVYWKFYCNKVIAANGCKLQ